jgi:hypothetical protein
VATEADAAAALQAMGVQPAARWDRPEPVYSQHRQVGDTDYWYLWNAGDTTVSFDPSFATTGTPYRLDLWTGAITRLGEYAGWRGRTSLPLTLRSGETVVLAFRHRTRAAVHAVASTAQEIVADGRSLVAIDTQGGIKRVVLSDGHTATVRLPQLPAPIAPTGWHLHVDEATPAGPVAHDLDVTTLEDWRDIPELALVSGTGTYTTTLTLPHGWTAGDRGTYLDLGSVGGAMQAYVNGTRVAPDVTPQRRYDISALLHPGANELEVVVTTMLKNELLKRARSGDATFALLNAMPYTEAYGLLGPVSLVPYGRATVVETHHR